MEVFLLLVALISLAGANESALESVVVGELDRAMHHWSTQGEAPHYVSVSIADADEFSLRLHDGTVGSRSQRQSRLIDIDLRMGTPQLDSTHPLRGFSALAGEERRPLTAPQSDGFALRHALWRELDARYREAEERIVVITANRNVKVEEEVAADDFEPRSPVVDRLEVTPVQVDLDAWETRLLPVAQALHDLPDALRATVSLDGGSRITTFVDTEGARLRHQHVRARLSLGLAAIADDGDEVYVSRTLDVHDMARLPDDAVLQTWVSDATDDMAARLKAPRGAPYSGPVLLTGKASGVFFHEVLGHRVEGHRQKREDEGRTFAEQVGRKVLPSWLHVYDDPTIQEMAGVQLNGFYRYDDEGAPAQRAPLVQDGRFVGFLMHRSPIPGFETTNGHGRRSAGHAPLARMGNTIVEASRTVSPAELRRRLIREVRRQRLEYGYMVDEIEGGFTMTGRVTPNAFNVRATTTYRVYADGRPDELIRGLDLVGTPLVAFNNLIAAGNDQAVFNGSCGAESGWVPVSAVAPSLLFSRLEFQLKEKGQERPPLLPKPSAGGDS